MNIQKKKITMNSKGKNIYIHTHITKFDVNGNRKGEEEKARGKEEKGKRDDFLEIKKKLNIDKNFILNFRVIDIYSQTFIRNRNTNSPLNQQNKKKSGPLLIYISTSFLPLPTPLPPPKKLQTPYLDSPTPNSNLKIPHTYSTSTASSPPSASSSPHTSPSIASTVKADPLLPLGSLPAYHASSTQVTIRSLARSLMP